MSKREISESRLTLPQVKKVLETIGEENLDQFQRRTLDYVSEAEAVQILNCLPETIDELRVFLAGGRKIIETQKLNQIVELLNENRLLK
jgi:DNA-directed RNA polymerase subunit F